MVCWRIANEWLLNGKKICRPITWQKHSYWFKSDSGIIMYSDGTPAEVHLNQIRADDWEIWREEKKTLSDEVQAGYGRIGRDYSEDKVKKAIREFIGWVEKKKNDTADESCLDSYWGINKKAREIFGTKLVEDDYED